MDTLIFQAEPKIIIGGCTFVNTPVIVDYDNVPLIQVVKAEEAGFTVEIPIYSRDGLYLAKVVGSRLFAGPDAKKANVVLRHPDKRTVCEMEGKTVFELERQEAAALKGAAELYTQDAAFLKVTDNTVANDLVKKDGTSIRVGRVLMTGSTFDGFRVGVSIKSDGSVVLGEGPGKLYVGSLRLGSS